MYEIATEIGRVVSPVTLLEWYTRSEELPLICVLILNSFKRQSVLFEHIRDWCKESYIKTQPDSFHSKYNLFQDDVSTCIRVFAWERLSLQFTSQKMLAKAAKVKDFEFVEYILQKEILWCSPLHMTLLIKSACHSPGKVRHYTSKFKEWLPDYVNKKNIERMILSSRHDRLEYNESLEKEARIFERDDVCVVRGVSVPTKRSCKYIQRCAIQENNLALFLDPSLCDICIDDGQRMPREEILRQWHKGPDILKHLKYTTEELDSLKYYPEDIIQNLDYVRYLQEMGSKRLNEVPLCCCVLNCSIPKDCNSELMMLLHKRGVVISQENINKAYLFSVRKPKRCVDVNIIPDLIIHHSYRPDIIRYFYSLCDLSNKRELAIVAYVRDNGMLLWIEQQ
jgi:hypothetical protein